MPSPDGVRSVTGKSVILTPVHANAGLEAEYRRRLDAMAAEMNASLIYWLKAAWRANPPEMAQDESPAMFFRGKFRKLAARWQRRFDRAAPELAAYFATAAKDRTDFALNAALRKAGVTVKFKMTAPMNDVMQATIGEQVGLIKSIASEHLSDIEGLVMRSVQRGGDLGSLTKEIEERYGKTRRRAALIARDQSMKATATVTRVRQLGLGITEAEWMHSRGGNHPRPSHVAASGRRYEIAKGCLIDGKYILPGTEINCRCVSRAILKALE